MNRCALIWAIKNIHAKKSNDNITDSSNRVSDSPRGGEDPHVLR